MSSNDNHQRCLAKMLYKKDSSLDPQNEMESATLPFNNKCATARTTVLLCCTSFVLDWVLDVFE